jgi:aspartate aminotransferase
MNALLALLFPFAATTGHLFSSQTSFAMASETTLPTTGSSKKLKTNSNYLSTIPHGPPDAILGIAEAFKTCTDTRKVNVCVGAYRDSTGKPWILPSVRKAEERLLSDAAFNKEYAPIAGDPTYVNLALQFAYGKDANLSNIDGVK